MSQIRQMIKTLKFHLDITEDEIKNTSLDRNQIEALLRSLKLMQQASEEAFDEILSNGSTKEKRHNIAENFVNLSQKLLSEWS